LEVANRASTVPLLCSVRRRFEAEGLHEIEGSSRNDRARTAAHRSMTSPYLPQPASKHWKTFCSKVDADARKTAAARVLRERRAARKLVIRGRGLKK
jgi:hypothetical protein